MVLYTKPVYSNTRSRETWGPGTNICVMSRLTENDGITIVDGLVRGEHFDEWIPTLAPPGRIVGQYYRDEISWAEFTFEYRLHLKKDPGRIKKMTDLAREAVSSDITLLCVEDDANKCHRSVLAEEMQKLEKELKVKHL